MAGKFGAIHTHAQPFLYITPNGGTFAGTPTRVPCKKITTFLKEFKDSSVKDNHSISYARIPDSDEGRNPYIQCGFQALDSDQTQIIVDLQKFGGVVEAFQEDEGRTADNSDCWVDDPALIGTIQIQGKDEWSMDFEGDVQVRKAT